MKLPRDSLRVVSAPLNPLNINPIPHSRPAFPFARTIYLHLPACNINAHRIHAVLCFSFLQKLYLFTGGDPLLRSDQNLELNCL